MHRQTNLFLFVVFATILGTIPIILTSVHGLQLNTGNIANNAVTSPKIRDGEVKTPDISNNAITTSKISNGAVEENDLADDSVTSDKIVDGSIVSADLAPGIIIGTSNEKLGDVSQIFFKTCTIDFPLIRAQERAFAFCPVTGSRVGDKVIVTSQNTASDILTQAASVNSTDIVKVAVKNPSLFGMDPPKISWAMIIFRTSP